MPSETKLPAGGECGCLKDGGDAKAKCCDGQVCDYTQISCGGVLQSKPQNAKCCLKVAYNPQTHVCCGQKTIVDSELCCSGHVVNPITQICCDGVLQSKPQNARCCLKEAFNYKTHVCCGKTTVVASMSLCCKGKPVDPISQICSKTNQPIHSVVRKSV